MDRLAVKVGDMLEIEGRLHDVVPDKEGGATLESAITMAAVEIHAARGSGAYRRRRGRAKWALDPEDS